MKTLPLLLILLSVIVPNTFAARRRNCTNSERPANEDDVINAIFFKSDGEPLTRHFRRPIKDTNKSIEVTLSLTIRGIIDIREKEQLVRLNGYPNIEWYDELHVWNDKPSYNCVETVAMPHGKKTGMWIPDIAFTSSEEKYQVTRSPDDMLKVASNGYVSFAPGGVLEFHCAFDLSLFPFDKQHCVMRFENWLYEAYQQRLIATGITLGDDTQLDDHEQWEVIGVSSESRDVPFYNNTATYSIAWFHITLKRKSGYYSLTIILPSMLIASIEILTFTMPFDKGIRMEVSFTCLLAFSVFQSAIAGEMPRSADRTPLLLAMISLFTVDIAIAIAIQSMCMGFACKGHRLVGSVPRVLLATADFLAPLVGLARLLPKTKKTPVVMEKESAGKTDGDDVSERGSTVTQDSERKPVKSDRECWLFVAQVADRIGFCLFTMLLIVTSITFLAIIPAARAGQ